jgi:hypothetical protein
MDCVVGQAVSSQLLTVEAQVWSQGATVRYAVYKAVGWFLLQALQLSPGNYHFTNDPTSHLWSGAGTVDPFVVTVPRDSPYGKNKKTKTVFKWA